MNTTNGNETMDELCAGWTWWCEKLAQKLVDQAHDLNKSEDELAHGFIGGRKSLIGGEAMKAIIFLPFLLWPHQ